MTYQRTYILSKRRLISLERDLDTVRINKTDWDYEASAFDGFNIIGNKNPERLGREIAALDFRIGQFPANIKSTNERETKLEYDHTGLEYEQSVPLEPYEEQVVIGSYLEDSTKLNMQNIMVNGVAD